MNVQKKTAIVWQRNSLVGVVTNVKKVTIVGARGVIVAAKRIPERDPKTGRKRPTSKHSDLYTDENPRGTIKKLGFTSGSSARESVRRIEKSGKPHKHMIQAAMAMEQRSRFAARRAKDPSKKKSLSLANKVYKGYINKLKKRTIALRKKKK